MRKVTDARDVEKIIYYTHLESILLLGSLQ